MKLTADVVKANNRAGREGRQGLQVKRCDGAFYSNTNHQQKYANKSSVKFFTLRFTQRQKKPNEKKDEREGRGKQSGQTAFFAAFNVQCSQQESTMRTRFSIPVQ